MVVRWVPHEPTNIPLRQNEIIELGLTFCHRSPGLISVGVRHDCHKEIQHEDNCDECEKHKEYVQPDVPVCVFDRGVIVFSKQDHVVLKGFFD